MSIKLKRGIATITMATIAGAGLLGFSSAANAKPAITASNAFAQAAANTADNAGDNVVRPQSIAGIFYDLMVNLAGMYVADAINGCNSNAVICSTTPTATPKLSDLD